jgi:hypothetical protein
VEKYILLTLLLVMSYLPAYGSSIIVARNNNEIIIGADSKRVRATTEDLRNTRSELICKIVRADNIVITSAGIVGIASYNQRGGIPPEFDLTEVMKNTALSEGSIMDKADTLAKLLSGDLLLSISEWAKKKVPALFKQIFIGGQLLQVVMAGLENGTPTFIVIAFEPSISPSGELKINFDFHPCPGIACPSNFVYIFMGKHEAIDRYLPQDPDMWKNDPVDVVRKLIEIEVTSEHETVGPPIDILRITKEGSEWIQKKDMCADLN